MGHRSDAARTLAWVLAAALAPNANADVIYVDSGAPAGGNGASWSSAFPQLHDALATAVSGDEVRVARGTYRPGAPGSLRSVTFAIPSGVTLRGGYAGRQSASPDMRDVDLFVTTLSGDLNGNDNAQFTALADNCLHVVTLMDADAQTIIEGFTIRGGAATGTPSDMLGGGMTIRGGSPLVRRCTFTMNNANGKGGAVSVSESSARFERCTFVSNRGTQQGGGVYTLNASATFTDCTLTGNIGGIGAGVFNQGGTCRYLRCTISGNLGQVGAPSGPGACETAAASVFEQCLFQNNQTNAGGGGIICFEGSTTKIMACRFLGNTGAGDGGGGLYVKNSSVTIASSFFAGNTGIAGGAIFVNGPGSTTILNCTILNNGLAPVTGGPFYGGIYSIGGANTLIRNTILWGNGTTGGTPFDGQLKFGGAGTVTVEHSRIQHWTGAPAGPGVSGAAPGFVQMNGLDGVPGTGDDSPVLFPGSGCVDAGVIDARSGPSDVLGAARFSGASLDIGCVELAACGVSDFDHDGDSGTDGDIEAFFACLGGACCETCNSADFNADGDTGTDADIEAFFRVLAGGAC